MGGLLGQIFTILSFSAALVATASFLMAATRKGPEAKGWASIGKVGFLVHGASVIGTVATLFYLIYTHQYQYQYVWSHSSDELPVHYMISCFWEGQEGSFLLWTFWHVILAQFVLFAGSKAWRNVVMGIISSINLILASMILGVYLPSFAGILIFALAALIPAGYLLYRYFNGKDSFQSNGIIPVMAGVIALGSVALMATRQGGQFDTAQFASYFSADGWVVLLGLLFILGFAAFIIYKAVMSVRGSDRETLNTSELFSAFAALLLGYVALSTDLESMKIGSSPFLMLRDAFPEAPIFKKNPDFVPVNGTGLNPLLQNPWMVIHPPTLFLGFASTSFPFAYVIGGLMTKRYTEWIRPAVPWLIFSVMILGMGIIMGGYWAYETLNFGGYWNWDAVENSSLVPWLAGVAALHALIAYRASKAFLKMTMVMIVGTFLLVLYSTFLTRSGVLGDTSVHTFTDLGLSGQLVLLLMIYIVWMTALFWSRWKMIPVGRRSIQTKSSEFVLFLAVITLLAVSIIITIATSIPVFNNVLGTNWATVRDPGFFYYRWTIWFAIGMAILSGLGQYLYWKKIGTGGKKLSTVLMRPYLLAIGATALIIGAIGLGTNWEFVFDQRYKEWQELADLSGNTAKMGFRYIRLGFFLFTDELLLFASLFMVFANADVLISLIRRNAKTRTVTGGSIAHLGFALMLIGFLFSSGYDQVISKNINPNELAALPQDSRVDNVLLEKNRPRDILGYQVTYIGKKEATPPFTDLDILWETEDEFKFSFRDQTGDKFGSQFPRVVFLGEDGEIDEDFVMEFLEDKVDALEIKHINDRTLYGLRFVPRKTGPDGNPYLLEEKAFVLYPEAEVNEEMGLVAHPARRVKAKEDIYVHVSTIPKDIEEAPEYEFYSFEMGIGDTVQTSRAAIYFEQLTSLPAEGTDYVLIAQAELKVFTDRGDVLRAQPQYRIMPDNRISIKDAFMEEIYTSIAFVNIDPSTGKMSLRVQEQKNPPEDIVVIQALKKPFINVLWLGTFVLLAGFIIAIVRRANEAKKLGGKSVVAESEYDDKSAG